MRITDLVPQRSPGRNMPAQADESDPIRSLQMDVDRAFDNFWRMLSAPFPTFSDFGVTDGSEAIRVDVSDNGKEVIVKAELPGMSEDDIDVSVSEGSLRIRGEKRMDNELRDAGVVMRERSYGVVERIVPLPEGIEPNAAQATFKNGVLTLVIPKTADFQSNEKHIPVQAG